MQCPECAAPLHGMRCRHLVAIELPAGARTPLDGVALPRLPAGWQRCEWTDEQVLRAFGDLAPLLDGYDARGD